MTTLTLEVPNIGCDGCVQTIKSELNGLDGVASVSGDVAQSSIQVEFDAPASLEQITAALREINYPPA